jgi:hypothetical protein
LLDDDESLEDDAREIILRTPVFTNATLDPLDSNYFSFFLSSMHEVLPYTDLFPMAITEIFSRGIQDSRVRHSVLGISAGVIDYRLKRSLDRFQIQYVTAIQQIQEAIQQLQIDEALAISVFLITWIDAIRGNFQNARKHLTGLRLILEELHKQGIALISPIVMQLWRCAIRLDWSSSFFLVFLPIFPIISASEELHRPWIAATASPGATEWVLAAFALDNLIHKACTLAVHVRNIRKQKGDTQEVDQKVWSVVGHLKAESRQWRDRPAIQIAEMAEVSAQQTLPSFGPRIGRFLHYPELRILNPTYADLLNTWRGLQIYISLISDPSLGSTSSPHRLGYAIDICRTWASLGNDKSHSIASKQWLIVLTWVALGGYRQHPEESLWVKKRIEAVIVHLPILSGAVAGYEQFGSTEGDFWEEMERVREVYFP